jgi:translation initiation factor IF-1
MPHAFKPGDKVVVFQYDGKERRGTVILTQTTTSGNKVRIQSGDLVLNVDEKPVSKDG